MTSPMHWKRKGWRLSYRLVSVDGVLSFPDPLTSSNFYGLSWWHSPTVSATLLPNKSVLDWRTFFEHFSNILKHFNFTSIQHSVVDARVLMMWASNLLCLADLPSCNAPLTRDCSWSQLVEVDLNFKLRFIFQTSIQISNFRV